MRNMFALCLISLAGVACAGEWKVQKYTAEYYQLKGNVGDKVKLSVAYIDTRADGGRNVEKGYVYVGAYTYYKEESGGWIEIAIPQKNLDYYLRRLGTRPRFKRDTYVMDTYMIRGILERGPSKDGDLVYYVKVIPPGSIK